MEVAFYNAFQKDTRLLDKVIALATFGRYSHVELVFSDGFCFSISPRENVVRYKKIDLKNKKWTVISLSKNRDENAIRELANLFLDKKYKYDYIGAITSALPFNIEKKDKVFCSELVGYLLGYSKSYKYTPNELYKILKSENK